MRERALYLALLILTLYSASSASANSFLLADEIMKMQTDCDFYIKITDNAILEGGEMYPMNPGEDYFKCVERLDNLKRQYISETLLGLSFYPDIFPMRLSNGSIVILSAPAEDDSADLPTTHSDYNHLEEMCAVHESCTRILDRLNKSITNNRSSPANYFKIKRSNCLEILDKLKMRYIDNNNLDVDFLKAYGELSVMCKNDITVMPLPESLKDEDNSRDGDVPSPTQPSGSKDDKEDESGLERVSYKGAYYNDIGRNIHPIIPIPFHKTEALVKPIAPKDSLKTSQLASTENEESVEHREEMDPSNGRIGPKDSKIVATDKSEGGVGDSVETILPVPAVANTLQSINNVHPTNRSPTSENIPMMPAKQDELEHFSFSMKATATDNGLISDPVTSPSIESAHENENSSELSDIERNQDNNKVEKYQTNVPEGTENITGGDDEKGKIKENFDKSEDQIRISTVSFEEKTDKVVENKKNVGDTDENVFKYIDSEKKGNKGDMQITDEKTFENGDNNKGGGNVDSSNNKVVVILSSEQKSSTTDTIANQDTEEEVENGVTVQSDSTTDKGDESLDDDNIGNNPATAGISKDSAENNGGEIEDTADNTSVVGQHTRDPDLSNDDANNNGPLRSYHPAEQQSTLALDHPSIITATPSRDTVGDELVERDDDCQQLLSLASKLLQYRTASYVDREYAECLEKLNQLKIQYIKSHGVDINKYRILFPVTLSDGTEKLIHLPPLHRESSTLPNTHSSQGDMFHDGDGLDYARVRHRSTNYVNRVRMDNPAFIPNQKFLEYFNNQGPAGEGSTLSKFASMIYRNVGRSEKRMEE